jgi:trk system potassium uptake protein TrkA
MRIVIAGCGRVGSDLAMTLSEEGHDISVIDERDETFEILGGTFDGTVHRGLAYDVRVLVEAGIEFADAFVQVARKVFGVPRTIARLDDPDRADAYRAMDVRYVAGAQLTSRVIHQQLIDREFDYHVTFPGGDVEIVEMELGDTAEGVTVKDFEVPGRLRVAAVRRRSRTLVPDAEFELHSGDLVVAGARHGVLSKVKKYLIDVEPELA